MMCGRNVVVTGAGSGIGRATVRLFAERHANVFACVHHLTDELAADFHQLETAHGISVCSVSLDLGDSTSINNAARVIMSQQKDIDALVNAAGTVGENALFQMTRMDEMRRVMEINFFGPMHFTQLISRLMCRRKRGSIVNVASIAGLDGDPAQLEYAASKAAIIAATRKLSAELAAFGIRVNAVAPGLTDTKMLDRMDERLERHLLDRMAVKRRAVPREIAEVIVFLASDRTSFVSGQTIRVDGGLGL